jgi:hypothetical protein
MSQLLIFFERGGREIERVVARDGEKPCMMAALLIWLEGGVTLTVEED